MYLLRKGNIEGAVKSLKFFRGCDYDVENEMQELSRYSCSDSNVGKKVIYEIFTSKLGVKSMLLSIGLLALQQFSGINGFVFNATTIFQVLI